MMALERYPDAPKEWVTVEVIKQVGYHDVHEVGEIISVDRKDVDMLVSNDYVRVIGSELL
jgi:acetylglutamate kinase